MKWAIEIQKTGLDTRNLSDLLRGLGFNLVEGIEYPALASPDIDASLTPADAFEKAKAVREAFKGPAQIDVNFVLGSVIDYSTNPPRRHAYLEAESCVQINTSSSGAVIISPPYGLSPTEIEQWHAEREEQQYQAKLERQRSKLEPAYSSERAAKVLELLSVNKPNAEILYKIYELAEGHPNNRTLFHQQFGITQDQFNRFRDAVHNPSVTGDWARHAYHGNPRTSNPMTKGEVDAFVRDISAKWLRSLRQPPLCSGA
ncbi:MAG: hypothetical protein Q7U98_01110 [Methylicorpusculum sp.]|uniref:hypothetical protein n=1 Tax=Methylicorpusculum sp. TaxID=2713644 RepID=UPI00271C8D7C|nr:hypothetical protein [Methylicorpusculum sp.]MDO8937739.1 hypothetical protein [Methylicorpusculum sp.]